MNKILLSIVAATSLFIVGCEPIPDGKFEGEVTEVRQGSGKCKSTQQYNYEVLYSFKNKETTEYKVNSYCTNKEFKVGDKVNIVIDASVVEAVYK